MRPLLPLLLGLLAACGGGPEQAPVGPPNPLDDSWLARVVDEPTRFSQLVDEARQGWAAFHRCDFDTAAADFEGKASSMRLGRARAEWELSLFYEDLARTEALIWERTLQSWR